MNKEIIKMFDRIQKVPYYCLEYRDSDNLFKKNKGCCLEKSIRLGKELRKLGISVKFYYIKFDWRKLPLSEEVIKLAKKPIGVHLALKARIGDKWIWIDPSWDSSLAKVGFPVTKNWNGKVNTKLAVKPIEIEEVEPKDKVTIKSGKKFFNSLNNYLEKVRKGRLNE